MRRKAWLPALVLVFLVWSGAEAWEDDLARSIHQAHREGRMVTNPSATRPDLDLDGAYRVQTALVQLATREDGGVMGYKAALTAPAAWKRFGLTEPVYGVLTRNMSLPPGASIRYSDFRRLFVEVEIAFILGRPITRPPSGLDEIKACVESAVPAIELPDVRLADLDKMNGTDVVADNTGAAAIIVGPAPAGLKDLAGLGQVNFRLLRDDSVIDQGRAAGPSGGPLENLLWLARAVTRRGGRLEKGALVMTGAMGRMLPARPGRYLADYGEFGRIEFTIR